MTLRSSPIVCLPSARLRSFCSLSVLSHLDELLNPYDFDDLHVVFVEKVVQFRREGHFAFLPLSCGSVR